MKFRVMISAPYMQPEMNRFRDLFAAHDVEVVVPPVNERLSEEELLQWVGDVDGVICGDDRFTEKVLRSAGRLKVISKWGTGIDSIDRKFAESIGISVRNTPDAFSQPVADTVLGYMLCFARQLPWMDREMRKGRWAKRPSFSLREATLGVIGVGNVGKAVIRRAAGFGMNILGTDPVAIDPDFLSHHGVTMVSKDELLQRADFISVNCDLNPTSFHLLDDAAFALTKPNAVVINTARGPIIHEAALVRALQEKRVGGAGLDVFEVEPLPAESPLLQMDNVMLASHNANSSPMAWERVHENTIRNLFAVLGLTFSGLGTER
jgi:D-3-phosphoglycerate dehydrogenase